MIIIFQIDLVDNLTGTSLSTIMLCSLELMFAILCTNIPMLRPWYRRWRREDSHQSNENFESQFRTIGRIGKSGHSINAFEMVSRRLSLRVDTVITVILTWLSSMEVQITMPTSTLATPAKSTTTAALKGC